MGGPADVACYTPAEFERKLDQLPACARPPSAGSTSPVARTRVIARRASGLDGALPPSGSVAPGAADQAILPRPSNSVRARCRRAAGRGRAAADDVVAAEPADDVVAAERGDHVAAARPADVVTPRGADDRRASGRTADDRRGPSRLLPARLRLTRGRRSRRADGSGGRRGCWRFHEPARSCRRGWMAIAATPLQEAGRRQDRLRRRRRPPRSRRRSAATRHRRSRCPSIPPTTSLPSPWSATASTLLVGAEVETEVAVADDPVGRPGAAERSTMASSSTEAGRDDAPVGLERRRGRNCPLSVTPRQRRCRRSCRASRCRRTGRPAGTPGGVVGPADHHDLAVGLERHAVAAVGAARVDAAGAVLVERLVGLALGRQPVDREVVLTRRVADQRRSCRRAGAHATRRPSPALSTTATPWAEALVRASRRC